MFRWLDFPRVVTIFRGNCRIPETSLGELEKFCPEVRYCLNGGDCTDRVGEFCVSNIHIVDWVVLAIYLAGSIAFGLGMSRRSRSLGEFLVGGRDVPWVIVLFSIVATETSTITFLSVPGEAYFGNLTFLQLGFGYILGRVVIVRALLPLYFRGQLYTSYQVLGQRFGGSTKQIASVLFLLTRTFADGLRLFLTAIVLHAIAGLPMHWSILVIGVVTVAYTFLGGMRAVVWMDCIQFFIYLAGASVAAWFIVRHVPDFWSTLASPEMSDKLRVFDFQFDWSSASYFGAALIGGAFLSLATHGADQLMVQRYLCARNQRQAGVALITSGVVVTLQFGFFLLLGTGLSIFFASHPPPQVFAKGDEVLPYFVAHHLSEVVGAVGIVVGACFAAAMSTLSSSLNSCATSAVTDLWESRAGADSPATTLKRIKALTIVFGAAQMMVALAGQVFASSVVQNVLAITGFASGVVLGVFLLAVSSQRASSREAVIAMTMGLVAVTGAKFGTDLAWPWFPVIGTAVTWVSGLLLTCRLPAQAGRE